MHFPRFRLGRPELQNAEHPTDRPHLDRHWVQWTKWLIVWKKSFRELLETFPRLSRLFPDSQGYPGWRPQKTFFRLFRGFGSECPNRYIHSVALHTVALHFPGFGGVSQDNRATPSEKGPVAPTFSALKGSDALQVASGGVSRCRSYTVACRAAVGHLVSGRDSLRDSCR